jgi:hypothetical protein
MQPIKKMAILNKVTFTNYSYFSLYYSRQLGLAEPVPHALKEPISERSGMISLLAKSSSYKTIKKSSKKIIKHKRILLAWFLVVTFHVLSNEL